MADWTPRIAASPSGPSLAQAVAALLAQQSVAWPLLAAGQEGLEGARTRTLDVNEHAVAVRTLPHRMRSTTARVDRASIEARPCFLCVQNLPPEQRGVAWGTEWVVLANPFPILPRHLTIVHRTHTPQRIAGRFGALLDLARWLPDSFVIYNGPECGASAPDHLHFQACDRSLLPVAELALPGAASVLDDPFRAIAIRGTDAEAVASTLERVAQAAGTLTGREPEALLNVAALHAAPEWRAFVFVRDKHRPDAFHRGELLVSPAAIDLSGIMVAPREEDFDRLTASVVAGIYDEVMAPWPTVEAVADRARNPR